MPPIGRKNSVHCHGEYVWRQAHMNGTWIYLPRVVYISWGLCHLCRVFIFMPWFLAFHLTANDVFAESIRGGSRQRLRLPCARHIVHVKYFCTGKLRFSGSDVSMVCWCSWPQMVWWIFFQQIKFCPGYLFQTRLMFYEHLKWWICSLYRGSDIYSLNH